MDLLEDLKMSLLTFTFVMIYIIHKILLLLKNCLNFPKVLFSNDFLRSMIDFFFFNLIFSITYNNGKFKS